MPGRRKKVRGAKQPTASFVVKSRIPDDRPLILDLWVKEPPAGILPTEELDKLPSPYLSEWSEGVSDEARFILMGHKRRFEGDGNPIFAIEAFLTARAAKLFPPAWILDWLEEAFKKFHDGQGKRSLEKILGLVPGKGQSPLFKALAEEDRDEMLCLHVFQLTTLFGISIDDASSMVARRIEDDPHWNKTNYRIASISGGTICDRYKRKWRKIFDREGARENLLRFWTKAKADQYLKLFPHDSYETLTIRSSLTR